MNLLLSNLPLSVAIAGATVALCLGRMSAEMFIALVTLLLGARGGMQMLERRKAAKAEKRDA